MQAQGCSRGGLEIGGLVTARPASCKLAPPLLPLSGFRDAEFPKTQDESKGVDADILAVVYLLRFSLRYSLFIIFCFVEEPNVRLATYHDIFFYLA